MTGKKPKPPPAKKQKNPKSDAEQSARFVALAKELGVDESGAAFDRAVEALIPKPKGRQK